MSWKQELQLRDLGPPEHLELFCTRCGYVRRVYPDDPRIADYAQLHLDEVERRARCRQKGCNGEIRLYLNTDEQTHSFQAGLT